MTDGGTSTETASSGDVIGGSGATGAQTESRVADADPDDGPDANRRAWTVVVFATMVVFGAAMMVRGPIVPELGATFRAPEWQVGLVAPAASVGYLVAVSVVGFGAGHVSPRRLVVAGLLANAASVIVLGAAPLLSVFLVAVALQGATIGAVRAVNRPLLSHYYPGARGRVFSLYDMTWAVGAALGPLLVVAVLALADWQSVADWRFVFWFLGALLLVLAARVRSLDAPAVESDEEPFTRDDVRDLLGRPAVLAMTAVMFFATGVEGGLFLWLPTYAAGELPGALASVSLSLYVGAYVPGRLVWGRIADRVGALPLLGAVLTALLPVFVWTFGYARGIWLLPGILGVGLLASAAFPLLTAHATDAAPEYSGPVTAIAAVTSSLGVGVLPALMGFAISGSDVATAMWLLAVPLVVSLVLVGLAGLSERRRGKDAAAERRIAD